MNDIITGGGELQSRSQPFKGQYFNDFVNYIEASPKTIETYTRQLRPFSEYLESHNITAPKRADVRAYRDYLIATGHKPTTIQNYITAVKIFFSWTEQAKLYPNIAEHIKGAKVDRSHKKENLKPKDIGAILDNIDRSTLHGIRDYAIFLLCVTCGLRTIEIARADICDIERTGTNAKLYVQGKGHDEKGDFVNLPQQTNQAITDYLKARNAQSTAEPLFTSLSNNSHGKRLTTRSISQICKDCMTAAGYTSDRLTAHSLRHTAATISLKNGNSIEQVQKFMRHSNITTTMIYIHDIEAENNKCSNTVADAIFANV